MPSRQKRKRYRQKLAQATATHGGFWGTDAPISRADLQLARRAIRDDWPMSASMRQAVTGDVLRVLGEATSPRRTTAAVRAILDMEAANMRAASQALAGL